MQPATVPSGSGRRRHASPPGAPIQTSGSIASASARGRWLGLGRQDDVELAAGEALLEVIVWPDCSRTLARGGRAVKSRITSGTCG